MNRLHSFLSDWKKFWGVVVAGAAVSLLGFKLVSWNNAISGRAPHRPREVETADSLARSVGQFELVGIPPEYRDRESNRFSVLANWLTATAQDYHKLRHRIHRMEVAIEELQRELARDSVRDTGSTLGHRLDLYSESDATQKL